MAKILHTMGTHHLCNRTQAPVQSYQSFQRVLSANSGILVFDIEVGSSNESITRSLSIDLDSLRSKYLYPCDGTISTATPSTTCSLEL